MGQGILKKIRLILDCFLEIIFPEPITCTMCGRVLKEANKYYLCTGCLSQIKCYSNSENKIPVEESIFKQDLHMAFDETYSACVYEGISRDLVHKLKYKDKQNIAKTMAAMIKDVLGNDLKYDMIVPVPIHPSRLKKRGYNQGELIASELENIVNIPMIKALKRTKNTPSQVLFNERDRWYNVKCAFSCTLNLKGKRILLIDDVITTGATAHYCAETLKASGAVYVTAVSFARTK
ncbi:hypothetical protein Q428_00765 [Fervidicella metallireducens AeB]|uniref:Phosphoribosyltransferase domain-containing protein n=1 Tax=Fervidicella metallireducens AeB TaxID=1403537 RepID=A0A017RZR1_9CLOT|nr:ComF family protein [Fervidicella metallireducens]EYE89889.1 hypothetical protein Q428_00765 [Fervidicella metallireducens AeB]